MFKQIKMKIEAFLWSIYASLLNLLPESPAKIWVTSRKAAGPVDAILGALVAFIVIAIGVYVIAEIIGNLPAATTALVGLQMSTAYNATLANIATGVTLFSVTPIVLAAGTLLAVVIGALAYFGMARGGE